MVPSVFRRIHFGTLPSSHLLVLEQCSQDPPSHNNLKDQHRPHHHTNHWPHRYPACREHLPHDPISIHEQHRYV